MSQVPGRAAAQGATPSMFDSPDQVLGVPRSHSKAQTHVGQFAVLGLILLAGLLIVVGLLYFQKNRTRAPAPALVQTAPGATQAANTDVENADIDRAKVEIKAKDDTQRRQVQAGEDAQRELAARAQVQAAQQAALHVAPARPAGAWAAPAPNPMQRKLSGHVMLTLDTPLALGTVPRNAGASSGSGPGAAPAASRAAATPGRPSEFSARLQGAELDSRQAGRLPNLDYLLKRGTAIPCSLKTGIDTTLPGIVICVAVHDVYSANGRLLLIERGAQIFGEQQSSLKQGQERTFVVWTRIDNPSGVYASIDSPATDQMGASGVPGTVNTHFAERFGGAIMLSFIKDYSQSIAGRAAGVTQSPVPYAGTSQTAQDLATEALRNSINVPPTLVVNPATLVTVLVARDISFENVYAVAK